MSSTTNDFRWLGTNGFGDNMMPVFRTPQDVVPELGMTVTELRRYCKESGNYTVLSMRRMVLDEANIQGVIAWVKAKSPEPKSIPALSPQEKDWFA